MGNYSILEYITDNLILIRSQNISKNKIGEIKIKVAEKIYKRSRTTWIQQIANVGQKKNKIM